MIGGTDESHWHGDDGSMLSLRSALTPLLFALLLAVPAAVRESLPVVGLNHLTVIPDSATFAAIEKSAFLRDTFALVERWPDERQSGSGVALFGRSTYIEFARPASGGANAWTSRLALGTDVRGALNAVAKRLTSEIGPVRLDSVMRRRDSADVPWLYQLEAAHARPDSALDVRVVEYHPQFVPRWNGAARGATTVARADVLAMYAAHVAPDAAKGRYPFVDVVGIKVAATVETEEMLLGHCRAVAWRVQTLSTGTACVGPGVRLFLVRATGAERGIVAFTMRVAPSKRVIASATHRFGRSTLRLSRNGFATWEFGQPR